MLQTDDMRIEIFQKIGDLPLFNPDIQILPSSAECLYQAICAADVVLIASPEYAHGVTGVMKNALDWMVGNDSFVNKPVVVWNTSPSAIHAHAALCETVRVMSADLLDAACIRLPILSNHTRQKMLNDFTLRDSIVQALAQLRDVYHTEQLKKST